MTKGMRLPRLPSTGSQW